MNKKNKINQLEISIHKKDFESMKRMIKILKKYENEIIELINIPKKRLNYE